MFVDASALTAILTGEAERPDFLERLQKAHVRMTSALAVWETTLAVARKLGLSVSKSSESVEEFLILAAIDVVPVDPAVRHLAIDAYDRFGKSRHPAALNFGDCFAYACARHAGTPLLFKGDDFAQTDIEAA